MGPSILMRPALLTCRQRMPCATCTGPDRASLLRVDPLCVVIARSISAVLDLDLGWTDKCSLVVDWDATKGVCLARALLRVARHGTPAVVHALIWPLVWRWGEAAAKQASALLSR